VLCAGKGDPLPTTFF
jgi:WD repeat-containing protein 26